eukprot:5382965-Amphidinium_carterae.1
MSGKMILRGSFDPWSWLKSLVRASTYLHLPGAPSSKLPKVPRSGAAVASRTTLEAALGPMPVCWLMVSPTATNAYSAVKLVPSNMFSTALAGLTFATEPSMGTDKLTSPACST